MSLAAEQAVVIKSVINKTTVKYLVDLVKLWNFK